MSALSPTQHTKLRSLVGRRVRARRDIAQSPLSTAPDVPRHEVGFVEDFIEIDNLYAVDFDTPFGVVLVEPNEIEDWPTLASATARTTASDLRRGSYGRWLGGSVPREFVTARVTPTEEGRRQIAATEVVIMADQLWVVFVDDIAQPDVLPYAASEDVALRLWREYTGRGDIARERLHALANNRNATALTIVQDIAFRLRDGYDAMNGADFLDYVTRELDHAHFLEDARADPRPQFHAVPNKNPALTIVENIALMLRDEDASINAADFLDYVTRELDAAGFLAWARANLTIEEQAALRTWADDHAPRWKAALRDAWETGNYGGSEDDWALQRIRNRLGPSWLEKYRLPANPSAATTGYRCWVRTRIKPNVTDVWMATRRADAVSQVKTAVRLHKSEGGVESQDPEKPFERTYGMVRGKLLETRHD